MSDHFTHVPETGQKPVYVLVHMKHVYDKALGRPVDHPRWLSAHETWEDASAAAMDFVTEKELISEVPLHCWWTMGTTEKDVHPWWLSNEFGPKKDVGNSMRISMRIMRMGDQR